MSVRLDQIVPWGRSLDEYRLMFALTDQDLGRTILGCGDGPASFNAEMAARGRRVISCDPAYATGIGDIRRRFEDGAKTILSQVRSKPQNYVWRYHRDPDDLLVKRRVAMEAFAADYPIGRRQGRYVAAALPRLPFADGQFDLAVCSHLLFLYSDLLSLEFHLSAAAELRRVAHDVRIFPLTSLNCEVSPYVEAVLVDCRAAGWQAQIIEVDYQLQANGDRMMRMTAQLGRCSRRGQSERKKPVHQR